jgi:hypothetical protein
MVWIAGLERIASDCHPRDQIQIDLIGNGHWNCLHNGSQY